MQPKKDKSLKINDDILRANKITIELFYIYYLDNKGELENAYLNQKSIKNFTEFCIDKYIEFDKLLYS